MASAGSLPVATPLHVPRRASRDQTRTQNHRLVLHHIVSSGSTSRAEIARATGLTPPTVSSLVAEMLSSGIVTSLGKADDAQVGKPRELVTIANGHYQVAAIDLSTPVFRGAVHDLDGTIIHEATADGVDLRGDDALAAALDLIAALASRMTATRRRIAIATPGVVDDTGVVRRATFFGWTDVDLASSIEARTGVEAIVVNDSHALALAEHAALSEPRANLVAVRVARGVSAGVILNGALHRGDGFAAGEVGFLLPNAATTGHESVVNVERIAESLGGDRTDDLAAVVAAAPPDDVRGVARTLGGDLARAIAAIVGVLDVHTVRLDPAVACLGDDLLTAARLELTQLVVDHIAERVDLRFGDAGDAAIRSGAVRAATHHDLGLA